MSPTVRNVLIVLALGALVAFTPTGGDVATVAGRALSLAFLAVLALGGVWAYRNNRMAIESLEPGLRIALYGGIAGLLFAAAGYSWLTVGGRTPIFLVIVAASVGALVIVWQRSRETY